MKSGDLLLAAYHAADSARRRIRKAGGVVTIDDMGRMVSRAYVLRRRMRSIHRVQVNRDRLPSGRYGEWIDLGGEA